MSIEDHERLLDIEDHTEFLATLELVDPDQRWIIQDIVADILWLTGRVRGHEYEVAHYKEEIDLLLNRFSF